MNYDENCKFFVWKNKSIYLHLDTIFIYLTDDHAHLSFCPTQRSTYQPSKYINSGKLIWHKKLPDSFQH